MQNIQRERENDACFIPQHSHYVMREIAIVQIGHFQDTTSIAL